MSAKFPIPKFWWGGGKTESVTSPSTIHKIHDQK